MSIVLYVLYTAVHLIIMLWGVSIWRRQHTLSTAILIGISFGLFYDNLILGLGTWLGEGALLFWLSWPRFILHQLVLPWMILAVYDQARLTGANWTKWRWGRGTAVLLSLLVMGLGFLTRLLPVQLEPELMDGVVRYVARNVSGPPIVSIVSIGLVGVMGLSWWRLRQWPWLTLIVILVFIGEGYPSEAVRRVVGSGLEAVLMSLLYLTTAQFPGLKQKSTPG
jgi:hypothetical protein